MFRQGRVDLLFVRVIAVASGEVDEARGHVNIAGPRTSHPVVGLASTHYLAYIDHVARYSRLCFAEQDHRNRLLSIVIVARANVAI